MKKEQIIILVTSFFVGMLLLHMVKNICRCDVIENFQVYYDINGSLINTNILDNDIKKCGKKLNSRCGGINQFHCNEDFNCRNYTGDINHYISNHCNGLDNFDQWRTGVCGGQDTLTTSPQVYPVSPCLSEDEYLQVLSTFAWEDIPLRFREVGNPEIKRFTDDELEKRRTNPDYSQVEKTHQIPSRTLGELSSYRCSDSTSQPQGQR